VALDEIVWPWDAKDPSVVYLPGKPHEWGIKVFAICQLGPRSKAPYLNWFEPDMDKLIRQADVLDSVKSVVGNKAAVTADRWFGCLSFMQTNFNMVTTMALKKCELQCLDLFSDGLKKGEYRLFSDG
jgi:hypothetical protein